jgi:FkbM family methyltransferase
VTASPQTVFDENLYLRHIEARGQLISRFVPELRSAMGLTTALDAGCGIGFFSSLLQECGLNVRAFDGRQKNVEAARVRFPGIPFDQGDVEDSSILGLGTYDLVLCFGLLYHLENPMRAIRHLRALTGKVLLLESMCVPSEDPYMLLREEPRDESQSLTDLAFYASEGCIVKMLYRSGFNAVYRVASLPDHDDFRETQEHTRRRTVLLAAYDPLTRSDLIALAEPHDAANPWDKFRPARVRLARRLRNFMASPARAKYASLARRLYRFFPRAAVPVRLPYGAWWLARNDHVSQPILDGNFEQAESSFVQRFLKSGMSVLDIGAHHGFYTLLCSHVVGAEGRVYAFEPSTRERNALLKHLRLNRRTNVQVMDFALGSENGDGSLYVVDGSQTGCNSLRPPKVQSGTAQVKVHVRRLDDWLEQQGILHIDFVKLDVEGGEIYALNGAERLLELRPRPVLLIEVQDIRARAWGYKARELIDDLRGRGFKWFSITGGGYLKPLNTDAEEFDGNFVACPHERERDLQVLVRGEATQTGHNFKT